MLLILQPLILTILTFTTQVHSIVQICMFKDSNPYCDITAGEGSHLCCTDHPAETCCYTQGTDYCYAAFGQDLQEDDFVDAYGDVPCKQDNFMWECKANSTGKVCCGPLPPPFPTPMLRCGALWRTRDPTGKGGEVEGERKCVTPDLFHYTTENGVGRDIFVPEGEDKVVADLLEAEDWEALAKYSDHHRRRS